MSSTSESELQPIVDADDLYYLDLSFSDEFSSSTLEENVQNQVKEMDLILMNLYPTTKAELEGWEWYKGIFQSPLLTVLLFVIPFLLLFLSTILFCVNKKRRKRISTDGDGDDNKNDTTGIITTTVSAQSRYSIAASRRRRGSPADDDDVVVLSSPSSSSSTLSMFCSWFRRVIWKEGLRIETSSLNVKDILEKEIDTMQKSKMTINGNNVSNNSYRFQRAGKLFKIHPRSHITEDDIRKVYPDLDTSENDSGDDDDDGNGNNSNGNNGNGNANANANTNNYYDSNRVVLFFRLASIFVSCGMSTIENHEILHNVSKALHLPLLSKLELGLNEITVQFELSSPVVTIQCSTAAFYQLSLLSRSQQLAYYIIKNGNRNSRQSSSLFIPASVYLRVLDELEQDNASDPYGWLIKISAIYIVCVFAPVSVYNGGYINLYWSSIISIAIVIVLLVLQSGIVPSSVSDRWECPIVSFITGLLSSILWQITADNGHIWQDMDLYQHLDQCAANYTIGVLLIWFPGSTLVYGAHEVCLGSYTNGGIRLIKGIVSAMVIALFYTLGWQYWGRNWASNETMNGIPTNLYNTTGGIASLPPSIDCTTPNDIELPWYINQVAFAIPLNAATMIVFNIRLRDTPGVFLVAQATYCVQGALGSCGGENDVYCGLPTYVNVLIVAFAGGCFSEINTLITGFSKYGSMLAIIFVLAPGAGAVKAILGAFHRTEGDDRGNEATIWESVVFEGVAYAVGFYLAFDVLSPIVTFITEAVITVKDEAVDVNNNDDDSSGSVGGGSNHKQDTTTTYGVINVEENSD